MYCILHEKVAVGMLLVLFVCVEGPGLVRCLSSTGNFGNGYDRLYPGHIPTSLSQKVLLSVGSSAMAFTCPWRGGMQLPL